MRKMIMAICFLVLFSSASFAGDAENTLLTSFEKLKTNAAATLTYEKYTELLSAAQQEFGNYSRTNKDIPPPSTFLEPIKQSLTAFESLKENWKQKTYWRKEEIIFERNGFWSSAERSRENQRKYDKLMQEDWQKAEDQLALANKDLVRMNAEKLEEEKEKAAAEKKPPARKKTRGKKGSEKKDMEEQY